MPVIGSPRTFEQKFLFTVEIDGFASAGFMTCSELASEFGEVSTRQGGQLAPEKRPGLLSFDDVTLTRGVVIGDADFYNWHRQVGDAQANAGLAEPAMLRTVDIVQRDRSQAEIKRYRLYNAWPKRYVAGDWDNSAEENVIETLVLCFDSYEKITG